MSRIGRRRERPRLEDSAVAHRGLPQLKNRGPANLVDCGALLVTGRGSVLPRFSPFADLTGVSGFGRLRV
jgi:hypothetical protein